MSTNSNETNAPPDHEYDGRLRQDQGVRRRLLESEQRDWHAKWFKKFHAPYTRRRQHTAYFDATIRTAELHLACAAQAIELGMASPFALERLRNALAMRNALLTPETADQLLEWELADVEVRRTHAELSLYGERVVREYVEQVCGGGNRDDTPGDPAHDH